MDDRNRIKVMLDNYGFMPETAHDEDAGYDIRTPDLLIVRAHDSVTVDTGVHMQIPRGYVGFLKSKSGLNVRDNLTGEGVIDAGYTGSIAVKLYNHGDRAKIFNRGDKIIQIVLLPIYKPELVLVEKLDETSRGDAGFGSTGR